MRALKHFFITMLCLFTLANCGTENPPSNATSPLEFATFSQLERGEYLARAGNCVACHTPLGSAAYSGGKAINTPFGVVYSSNLTSDKANGIGSWNASDFWQAMHHGKSQDGRNLYPAFPYPSYTQITRDDSDALFIFFQTIPADPAKAPTHELRFPYNTKIALSAWRSLFFKAETHKQNSDRSDSWNQGAYLVKGLGHCGACHTPLGVFGNTQLDQELSGAYLEQHGWDALALTTGPLDSEEKQELVTLLKTGGNEREQLSGPMAEVVFHSLQHLSEEHLGNMVEYIASVPITPTKLRSTLPTTEENAINLRMEGEGIYTKHCSDCHGESGEGKAFQYPALAGNSGVTATSPNNAIRSLKQGGFGASTTARPQPYGMPAYAHQLNAQEAAAVLSYIRGAWGNTADAVSTRAWLRD